MGMKKLLKKEVFAHKDDTTASEHLPLMQRPFQLNTTTLSAIRRDVLDYNNFNHHPLVFSLTMKLAVYETSMQFKHLEVKVIHLKDVFSKELAIWDDSPGLPWCNDGYLRKSDIKVNTEAVRQVRFFWHRVKLGEDLGVADCCVHAPGYVKDISDIVDTVWTYPATMTFAETMFAEPLINGYKTVPYGVITFDFKTFPEKTAARIQQQFTNHPFYSVLVFTNFDKSVPTELIPKAFNILCLNINLLEYEQGGVPYTKRLYRLYKYITDYFLNTPIRLADGTRYKKNSGIAKGSCFTQLIRSITNTILVNWICLELTGYKPNQIKVLDNNSLIATDKKLHLNEVWYSILEMCSNGNPQGHHTLQHSLRQFASSKFDNYWVNMRQTYLSSIRHL